MKKLRRTETRKSWAKLLGGSFSFFLIVVLLTPARAVVFSNTASITLSDATTVGSSNPYSSNVTVSGMTGTVTNVTLTLENINHTFPDDVDILLVAPNGNNLIVMSDVGGSADIYNVTVVLDDAAAASLPDALQLLNGTYKPTNSVTGDTFNAPAPTPSTNTTFAAAFGGIDPNGAWNLYVVDDAGGDYGTIGNGFTLTVTTSGSPATSFRNLTPILGGEGGRGRAATYASAITASGLAGAITSVKVTLTNLSHLNPDDLDILLVGPSGKRIILLSDAGGTADVVDQTVTFDDAAAAAIPDAGPLVAGTFRPANYVSGDTFPEITLPVPNSAPIGTATLGSVFNGTEGNGVWRLYIVDDATASAGTLSGGWSLDITAGGTYGAKRFTSADFDGDGKTDIGVFRPSEGNWWNRSSATYANSALRWGATGDAAIPADYDGDGKTDLTVFRPSTAQWFVFNSATSTVSIVRWGLSSDRLVPADYDGDGKTDLAVFRPSEGNWYIRQSTTSAMRVVKWGVSTDIPVRGHFEGTDGADFAVFRPSEGNWYILNNAGSASRVVGWGISTDTLAPADYDGDGKTDIAVFRPSDGVWYVVQSASASPAFLRWGQSGDVAVPGDYDGDSRADFAIFRPSEGNWYMVNSGTPFGTAAFRVENWGLGTDSMLPATYLP